MAQAVFGSSVDGDTTSETFTEVQAEAGLIVAHVHKVSVEQALWELSPGIENCKI